MDPTILVALLLTDFTPFVGPMAGTRPAFESAYGQPAPIESFDLFGAGQQVGDLPAVDAFFAPEDAAGDPLPLPFVVSGSPVSAPNWMANFGAGRPAWSPWVIKPAEGESIYAFGQINSQGDWVRIEAFDEDGDLIGSVDSTPQNHTFAGFLSTTPVARVVVTPLGNGDGLNGMDDVQVGVAPHNPCPPDLNCDGVLNILDFVMFQNLFLSGDLAADCDGNGSLNVLDFVCYQAQFVAGCD